MINSRTKILIFQSVGILLIFASVISYMLRINLSGHYYGNTDFFIFYESVRFYFAGQDLYSPVILESPKLHTAMVKYGNLNPPLFTLFLLPLYFVSYAKALQIWTVISMSAMFLSISILLRIFSQYQKYFWLILAGFGLYISNSIAISYGQVSNILLLLMVGCWYFGRNRKAALAGVCLGIACAIKLFCGLFFIYFLLTKQFRIIFSAVLTGLFILLLTVSLFGIDNYMSYIQTLNKICWYAESWSVSFKGFFMRLFTSTEQNVPLCNLPYLAEILVAIFSLGLFCWLVYVWSELNEKKTRLDTNANPTLSFDLGFSLVIISMLLLSPLGWFYYFNLLIIPYLVLISESRDDRVHLACCGLLLLSSLAGDLIKTFDIKTMTQVLYNGGNGFYVLVIMLLLLMRLVYQKIYQPIDISKSEPFQDIHKRNFISENLFLIIYIIALSPSAMSQIKILHNISILSSSLSL